jgi:hypothetical protein
MRQLPLSCQQGDHSSQRLKEATVDDWVALLKEQPFPLQDVNTEKHFLKWLTTLSL